MKKLIISAALIPMLVLLLCSCSVGPRSAESLMRPPYSGTERELQKSISNLLGSEISLCSPETGEYHTAITMRDIDRDKENEAVIFYLKNRDSTAARMSVLHKTENGWAIVADFAGNGSNVQSLSFADLNNDGYEDILASWTLFDNKVNKSLTVYSCSVSDKGLGIEACATEPFNLMSVEDVFGSGERQIMLAYTDTSKMPQRTSLRMIGMTGTNSVSLICETRLDAGITSLASMLTDKPEGSKYPRIFIDANVSDNQMITEVLTWSEASKNFSLMFDEKMLPSNAVTMRSSNLKSKDIDNDGLIEIPLRRPMAESKDGDTSAGYVLEWCGVVGGGLLPKQYYVVNAQENYRLFFPIAWKNTVFVKSDNVQRAWIFVNKDSTVLFKISVFDLNGWDENSSNVTDVLLVQNDTVYTCTITEAGSKAGIIETDLIKYFELDVQ